MARASFVTFQSSLLDELLQAVRELTSVLAMQGPSQPALDNSAIMWKVLASIMDRLFFIFQLLILILICYLYFPRHIELETPESEQTL